MREGREIADELVCGSIVKSGFFSVHSGQQLPLIVGKSLQQVQPVAQQKNCKPAPYETILQRAGDFSVGERLIAERRVQKVI